jgi:hypothetical protein
VPLTVRIKPRKRLVRGRSCLPDKELVETAMLTPLAADTTQHLVYATAFYLDPDTFFYRIIRRVCHCQFSLKSQCRVLACGPGS